ncbi:PTS glucose transporter subunit IIA [Bacillus licheniformis]|nr:PTS glucose transporter subunit IIA [Bacillus licheniformis]
MGEGIAIIPSKGELYAPVDGEISLLFETNHALGMKQQTELRFFSILGSTPFS